MRIDGHEPLAAAGGSLRDMTRVAGANPRIWIDIFLDNADAVRESLGEHRRRIEQLEARWSRATPGSSRGGSREASGNRRRMLADAYEDPGALQRLRVHVPDRPGVLAGITQALGAERINIEDFELTTCRRSAAACSRVLVTGEEPARRARPSCSRRRATASSSRRWSTSEDRTSPRARRARGRAGRQVDLAPSGAARCGRRRGDRDHRLRPLGRHRVDAAGGARARRGGRGARHRRRARPRSRASWADARRTGRSTRATRER